MSMPRDSTDTEEVYFFIPVSEGLSFSPHCLSCGTPTDTQLIVTAGYRAVAENSPLHLDHAIPLCSECQTARFERDRRSTHRKIVTTVLTTAAGIGSTSLAMAMGCAEIAALVSGLLAAFVSMHLLGPLQRRLLNTQHRRRFPKHRPVQLHCLRDPRLGEGAFWYLKLDNPSTAKMFSAHNKHAKRDKEMRRKQR